MNPRERLKYSYKNRTTSLILWGILLLSLFLILIGGYKITKSSLEYAEGNDVYEELAQNKSEDKKINFQELQSINPQVVAWISRTGTGLDYPVVRGSDNDYYLTHLVDGTTNKLGSIFMDYRNDPNFEDKNTIIYGHNMKNGAMFAVLMNYTKQKFYNDYPTIEIATPGAIYNMKIFAGFVVDANDFDASMTFDNNVEFMEYINKVKEKSTIDSPVVVKPTDRIVTLYTCTYDYQDARYVLMGVI